MENNSPKEFGERFILEHVGFAWIAAGNELLGGGRGEEGGGVTAKGAARVSVQRTEAAADEVDCRSFLFLHYLGKFETFEYCFRSLGSLDTQ